MADDDYKLRIATKGECGTVAFYPATKKDMKNIVENGLKPGTKNSWQDIHCNMRKKIIGEKREDCDKNTFLSGSLDYGIENFLPKLPDLDAVAALCIPQDKIYLPKEKYVKGYKEPLYEDTGEEYIDETFEDWDARRGDELLDQEGMFLYQHPEIVIKETIPPENIIGCIDIIKNNNGTLKTYDKDVSGAPNRYRYKINKKCKF
jgi:hypothetical protein